MVDVSKCALKHIALFSPPRAHGELVMAKKRDV
jgi:hypothetical protein